MQLLQLGLLPFIFSILELLPSGFYTTYQYTAYTVYDTTSPDAPTPVPNVGGTLRLNADGSYEKHFRLLFADGPHYFNQTGRFTVSNDSIRFAFTDLKGADVQRGTFRYDSATRHLTLTIDGFPAGNKGVYELMASPAPPSAPRPRPRR